MKKLLTILTVVGLLGLLTTAAMAATDNDVVTVTVNAVDQLEVPATAALTLDVSPANPGATTYTQGTLTQTDGLLYSHNSTGTKKITATAVKDVGNAANDIDLGVMIEAQTAADVVAAGVDQADVELWTGIAAGGYTLDLDWTADGSLGTTKVGSYTWTVTFTSADV